MRDLITMKDVCKSYSRIQALSHLSFEVKEYEFMGLIGPNGAGKSTALKILSCLIHPDSGQAKVDDFDVVRQQVEVKKRVGLVPQVCNLDNDLTPRQNLEFHAKFHKYPERIRKRRIDELLEFIELSKRQKDDVRVLSPGMKKRLLVARALLHDPKILLLDQPSDGLDFQTKEKFWNLLGYLREEKGLSILMATHDKEEAQRLCDRVAIIVQGKVAAICEPHKLSGSFSNLLVR